MNMANDETAVSKKEVTFLSNGEEVKLTGNMVKQFLVSGNGAVSDQEVLMFLSLCQYQHLNPFLNEAYLVKFKGDKPAQIIVSKEAFMKRAESHPEFAGMEAGIVVARGEEMLELPGAIKLPKDHLVGAWAKVYRKDRERPIHIQIALNEFSKGQATWNQMPQTMIRKTAIVNALREAFPQELGAMYTDDDKQPEPTGVSSSPKPADTQVREQEPETKALENKVFGASNKVLEKEEPEVIEQEEFDLSYSDPNAKVKEVSADADVD